MRIIEMKNNQLYLQYDKEGMYVNTMTENRLMRGGDSIEVKLVEGNLNVIGVDKWGNPLTFLVKDVPVDQFIQLCVDFQDYKDFCTQPH